MSPSLSYEPHRKSVPCSLGCIFGDKVHGGGLGAYQIRFLCLNEKILMVEMVLRNHGKKHFVLWICQNSTSLYDMYNVDLNLG